MDPKDQIAEQVLKCFVVAKGNKVHCLEALGEMMGYVPSDLVTHVLHSKTMLSALISALESYGASLKAIEQVKALGAEAVDASAISRADLQQQVQRFFAKFDKKTLSLTSLPTLSLPEGKQETQTQIKETKSMTTPAAKTLKDFSKEDEQIINTMDITRKGTSLILPEHVTIPLAIAALARKQQSEEEFADFSYDYKVNVAEGVVAFLRVIQREFGFVSTKKPGLFQPPPTYISISVATDQKESVPWGDLEIPGIEGTLSPSRATVRGQIVFSIQGSIKGKSRPEAMRICKLIEEECKAHSIYKGKAIMSGFPTIDEVDSMESTFPEFFTFANYTEKDLIFPKHIEDQIDSNLFTPIKKIQRCREEGISLKRSVLLPGPFGTGKTLTATVTANICKDYGWTFIYLTDVTRLERAYEFAKQYQPAIIFAEDVDKAIAGKRDLDMDKILNKVDGIDSKGLEIIMVLTTNSKPEDLEQAMLRPGRLDAVIPILAPDAEAAVRLVQHYAGSRLAPNQDLTPVGALLDGAIPAFIEEVVKRSKLASLRRDEEVIQLTADDLVVTAQGMQAHLKLLEPRVEDERSDEERAAQIVADGHVSAAKVRVGLPPEETNGRLVGRTPQPRASA